MGYFRENIENAQAYAPGFQPGGTDVIKLNTNENPYPPSPQVINALSRITPEQLRRYPDPTANAFRQAAAELHEVTPDHIICGNGADGLLRMAFQAFTDHTRPVAYPVPTYSLYPVLARLNNVNAVEVPFDREFNLPPKLAHTNAPLTIVCNPNAPSGTCISKAELACLADELAGVLLIDEAYVDFAENDCLSLIRDFDNVIILRSMSKGYSLAGLRFGYAVAQPNLTAGLMKIKDSYNVDAVAIAAAVAAVKDQDYFLQNIRKLKQNRRLLTAQLRALKFQLPDSFANFLLAQSKKNNAEQIYRQLIQRNIYVRYFNQPGLQDKLRITIGTSRQNDTLLLAMQEIISQSE